MYPRAVWVNMPEKRNQCRQMSTANTLRKTSVMASGVSSESLPTYTCGRKKREWK